MPRQSPLPITRQRAMTPALTPPSSPALQSIARREQLLLAPYAFRSIDTRGRKYPEPEHPYRGPFQRDRDRIIHSAAFRRLSGKMQVFTGEMGDYHRTRLTHTQEVASLARTLGRALRLNEDLIEALALLHDIGHPPYGHAGEDALDAALGPNESFSHNRFALTVVEELEQRYTGFPGLNLSDEVLESQRTRIDKANSQRVPLLEAQLVDAADSMTYDAHDTDDAVKLGLLTLDELTETTLVRDALQHVRRRYTIGDPTLLRVAVVHQLIERQVTDILTCTADALARLDFADAEQARHAPSVIGTSTELTQQKRELERFLYQRVYRHPDLIAVRSRAQLRLQRMFEEYQQRPELFPEKYRQRAERVGVRQMAVDYLAGMTDRFCDDRYREMFPEG